MTQLGAQDERSKMLRTHCQTSGVSLTEQDPVQQRHPHHDRGDGGDAGRHPVAPHQQLDEAIALPTDFSARIARNTQIVIQEETGMTKVVDPLGGSYYVEALTQELVDKAWAIIERVEADGRHGQGGRAAGPRR
jgi:methylmalonyl-CoA mutase